MSKKSNKKNKKSNKNKATKKKHEKSKAKADIPLIVGSGTTLAVGIGAIREGLLRLRDFTGGSRYTLIFER